MRLSFYAKNEWLTILAIGLLLAVASVLLAWWVLLLLVAVCTAALLLFFRDPERSVPTQRGVMVAPCDGKVTSVHDVEYFEPFGGPAVCVRIFISLLDVHVVRSPCHATITSIAHTPGKHGSAMNPESLEDNESSMTLLEHPIRRYPIAAVRQIAGMFARTIVCGVQEQQTLQRGQRIGMIKLGSAGELFIPKDIHPQVAVRVGQTVRAGATVIASIQAKDVSQNELAEQSEPIEKAPQAEPSTESNAMHSAQNTDPADPADNSATTPLFQN